MKKITIRVLCCVGALGFGPAMAMGPGYYAGASLTRIDYSQGSYTSEPIVLSGMVGQQFSPNFAGEVRLGLGLSSSTNRGLTTKIGHIFGLYARGIAPLTPQASVYGLLGISNVGRTLSATGYSDDKSSGGDLSFGVGASFAVNHQLSLDLEWMRYYDKSSISISGLTLATRFRF